MSEQTAFILSFLKDLTDIEFCYDHFAEGESPKPPFIAFLSPKSDNFGADGKVYYPINEVNVEVYTDRKFPRLEKLIEKLFEIAGIFYEKSEVWITEEKLYEVFYSYQEAVNKDLSEVTQRFIDEFPELEERINTLAANRQTIDGLQKQINFLMSLHNVIKPVLDFAFTGDVLPEECTESDLFINLAESKLYTAIDDNKWDKGVFISFGDRYASRTDLKIYTCVRGGWEDTAISDMTIFLCRYDGNYYFYNALTDSFDLYRERRSF